MTDRTTPTHLSSGDLERQRTDYYPHWLDNRPDDVVRTVLGYARTLFEGAR